MNFRATRILAAAVLANGCTLAIGASPATTTFQVSATVVSNCIIQSAGAMAFGSYTPGNGVAVNIDVDSTILVRCSSGTPYGIGLNEGVAAGSTPSFDPRVMTSSVTGTLEYNLFTDAARTIPWVNPTATTAVTGNQANTGGGMNVTRSHTVYGRLLDSTNSRAAMPGDYSSLVTVTVNY
jgi:spore coat protein U-like protein